MRKLMFVLFGLALLGGSLYVFNHRHELVGRPKVATRSLEPSAAPATRGVNPGSQPSARSSEAQRKDRSDGPSWKVVDRALDVLNLLVGVIGIVMAMRAMRSTSGSTGARADR